jgi:hypothetical protein
MLNTGLFVFAAIASLAAPIASHAADPLFVAAPALKSGDLWIYDQTRERGTTGFSQQRIDLTVDRVDSETMVIGIKADGAPTSFQDHVAGLDWSQRRMVNGQQTTTGRPFTFPLTVGSTWSADYDEPRPQGIQVSAHFHTV